MDDKFLEKRLQNLKSSYEELPTVSQPKDIVTKIKMTERKSKKKYLFHLPFAASFIGVLLIGSLLAMQLLNNENDIQQGSNKDPQSELLQVPTQDEIEEKSKELSSYYEELLTYLKNNLETENVERYSFVKDSKYVVDRFGDPSFKVFTNKQDLNDYFESTKYYIGYKLLTPKQHIDALSQRKNEIPDDEILGLIIKQEEILKTIYEPKWNQDSNAIYREMSDIGLSAILERLNSKHDFKSEEINTFAKTVVSNGFIFEHVGEGMIEITKDYSRLSQLNVSQQITDYFTMIQERIVMDAALIITWNELSDRIVKLERFILSNPNFPDNKILYELYKRYFTFYTTSLLDNTPIYDRDVLIEEVKSSYERFMEINKGTETAQVINDFYQRLEENNFKRVDNPEIPELITIEP
ncbi:hypothetical protein IMZ08_05255 [Bacillus luteolus]|uniref:Uncharacterized protein n=1 Tax=Litchfieldia luteola TaxID=682179 RepID=A0ABR9QGB6_9BACI|nr:hypothetical protein [Cytobacillus luteolus]MBE4907471.1 hypothetical protein [Cytobacillus luteolus]MBP1944238.1 hypothetical protein [Cytobacillus luteolus]